MRLTSFEITMAVLGTIYAAGVITRHRRHRREQAARLALVDLAIGRHPAAVADALIQATRDQAHETYAWGPGQPVTRTDLYPCGCTVLISEDAVGWMPCPAHEAMAEVEARTEQT